MKIIEVQVIVLPSEDEFNNYEVMVLDGKKTKKYHERIHYQTEKAQGDEFFGRLINTAIRLAK